MSTVIHIAEGVALYGLVMLAIAQFMGFNDRRGAVGRSVAPQCGRRQRRGALPPASDRE